MKILICTFFLFIVFVFSSCFEQEKVAEPWLITDFTQQEQRIALLMDEKPMSIQLTVKGEVDGDFQIYLRGAGAGNYRQLHFKENNLDSVYTQPWNSQNCTTIFLPGTAKSGNVTVDVKLLTSPIQ